ncbi:MAG: hypothetical protein CVV64_08870 [Candidatus Wallbacteria bacterium HGW-Wallbacteria-1]|jgi:hypothetical protein|uniref:Uncharacterized protein n=1 Tax=Candidatus Wallbacteria bacterium HGW-Wallbacteria-1 TaxID=2013854 RepID=A0A2N1PQ53_9BACT|nr:MAG: hypothetical protein CVV64_08870 [Candidatus Wallbacteria bacterium HGW-Wallbacteria-1]
MFDHYFAASALFRLSARLIAVLMATGIYHTLRHKLGNTSELSVCIALLFAFSLFSSMAHKGKSQVSPTLNSSSSRTISTRYRSLSLTLLICATELTVLLNFFDEHSFKVTVTVGIVSFVFLMAGRTEALLEMNSPSDEREIRNQVT